MHQPMQGARRMTESEYRRLHLCEWPAEQIAKQRQDVLRGKDYGLSVAQIADALSISRNDVRAVLLEEERRSEQPK